MGKTQKKNKSKGNTKNNTDEFTNLNIKERIIKENRSGKRPFVSVIVPTWNRRKFLPNVINQFFYQTYPQEYMEMIIVDDSTESNLDIITKASNIKYHHLSEKLILSEKRNYLNKLATGDIIVCFDDDDYYSPDRVTSAVKKLMSSRCLIAGSTTINIYYKELNQIYQFGPYGANHATNGTMAYKKEYLLNHSYLSDKHVAEESHFTNSFREPLVQIDPQNVMLCLAHSTNTVDKTQFIPKGKLTTFTLEKFFNNNNNNTEMINWIKNNV